MQAKRAEKLLYLIMEENFISLEYSRNVSNNLYKNYKGKLHEIAAVFDHVLP